MHKNDENNHVPEKSEQKNIGWFKEFFRRVQLAWYLLVDNRVPWLTKLIPVLTLAYIVSPVDFVPDLALGLGQLDDIAIFLLGVQLFVELSPYDVVDEHMQALAQGYSIKTARKQDSDVIDVEFTVDSDEEPDA